MAENICIIVFGVAAIAVGVLNCCGIIETIHWYHRKLVSEEDKKPYAMGMGVGTVVIGVSALVCSILDWVLQSEQVYFGLLAGCIMGVLIMLCVQIKYTRKKP